MTSMELPLVTFDISCCSYFTFSEHPLTMGSESNYEMVKNESYGLVQRQTSSETK